MRLAIVGTGMMANHHASAFSAIEGVEVVAAVDVRDELLAAFCEKHAIAEKFPDVGQLVDWGKFDAACVVTPDNAHHPVTMPLLKAGKHVLCEKPLAPNHSDAKEMADAAKKAGVVNMVNFTYRKSRALAKAHEIVKAGGLGNIRHIEAAYLQSWLTQDSWGDWRTEPTWLWRLSKKHGSMGALGDVGIHLLDFTCHATCCNVADLSCKLQTFHKAEGDKIGEYVLDANDSFAIIAKMDNEALAVMHATRFASGYINMLKLRVHGDKGGMEVLFSHNPEAEKVDSVTTCTGDEIKDVVWKEVETSPVQTVMETFAECVKENKQCKPDFEHAANLQLVLDNAFESDERSASVALA